MDSEDEGLPYLKLLNENSGHYLVQNSYELQDSLSVEPIFTEIETTTWPVESYPILLNSSSLGDNINLKEITDGKYERLQGQISDKKSNTHFKSSYLAKCEEAVDLANQKQSVSSSSVYSVVSQDSVFKTNTRSSNVFSENQQGKQKRALFTMNGNTYEITFSNKATEMQDVVVENDISHNRIEINDRPIVTNDHYGVEGDEDNSSTSECRKQMESNDLSNWNEFHTIVLARKCKVCSFLCESLVEITNHMELAHQDLMTTKPLEENGHDDGKQQVKMRSLLDTSSTKGKNNTIIFMCTVCNNMYLNKESVTEHMKEHMEGSNRPTTDENNLTNALDDTPTNSMRNRATSLLKKQQRAMRKIKCSVKGCNLRFSNNESKFRHEKCHIPDEKNFECPECKEKFLLWRLCSKHLWTCHKIDAGLYTCPICEKYKSNSTVLVLNHMDIHNSEKPFLCPECGKGFKQIGQLRNHSIIHNKKESKIICNICDRSFSNNKSLTKHIQSVHEKLKPYVCSVCGHRTSRKAMLELHFRLHTGEKPHHCPHCTYKASDHNCLRRHVMKHVGVMQYSCPYCKYQAIQSSSYKNHLMTKHPDEEVIYKCGYCTFTSLKCDSYLTHIKCHEHDKQEGNQEEASKAFISAGESEDIEADNEEYSQEM